MKKLYFFLLMALTFSLGVNAATHKFTLNIEDASKVIVERLNSDKVVEETYNIQNGENSISIEVESFFNTYTLRVTPVEGYILKAFNEDGTVNYNAVSDNKIEEYCGAFGGDDVYYILKTIPEAEYRDRTVKVTIDNPNGLRLQLRGNKAFNTTENEYEIPFSSVYENLLYLNTVDRDDVIYKVEADGIEVKPSSTGSYDIVLADYSDPDDPLFTENINIQYEFPEDLNYTVKIGFTNNNPECLQSVTYAGEEIEDYAAAEGFIVRPGKKLTVTVNSLYHKLAGYKVNGESEEVFGDVYSVVVLSDIELEFDAAPYEVMNAQIIIDGVEGITLTNYKTHKEVEAVNGANDLSFTEKDNSYYVAVKPGYELTEVYDDTYEKDYLASYFSGYLYLDKDSKIYLTAKKIVFDSDVVVYIDDLTDVYYGLSLTCGKSTYSTYDAGYFTFPFRKADGGIKFSASGVKSANGYINGEAIEIGYPSYFTLNDINDGDVVKVFFKPENAIEHTVKFEASEGLLDGFEIKKDIVSSVDPADDVKAVGKTRFTMTPVSRANEDLTVKVGDQEIEAVDGVYTFETEGDTTVSVLSTSGIADVTVGENQTHDVYNLQGIRVAHNANSADFNNLPAGIYIINGKKIAIK